MIPHSNEKAVRRQDGFTMIELMVALVIVGILAAVAYPSYLESVRKTRRADAQSSLVALAGAMERVYIQTTDYLDGTDGATCAATDTPATFSDQVPTEGGTATYNLRITVTCNAGGVGTAYTLSAAPTGPQTDDRCGTFTLTSLGQRDLVGEQSGLTLDDCWRS